jgi:integrase/recombinase XerD
MESYLEKLIFEIEIRGLAKSTKNAYLRNVKKFLEFYACDPKDLGIEDIKKFLHHLQNQKSLGKKTKLSPNSVNGSASSISFFYQNVIKINYQAEIPRMKTPKTDPIILSHDEMMLMIDGLNNVFWKAVLMTLYSTGVRQSELRNLKINDIDSKRMVIYIRNAKGAKDRQLILSPVLLKTLRTYWQHYRIDRNSDVDSSFLFIPNKNTYDGVLKKSLSHTAVGYIVKRAGKIAGIKKKVHPHCIRHSYAVQLVERGVHFRHIQYLLGHSSPRTTSNYTMVADITTIDLPELLGAK